MVDALIREREYTLLSLCYKTFCMLLPFVNKSLIALL